MSVLKPAGLAAAVLTIGAWSSGAPAVDTRSTWDDTPAARKAPPTRSIDHPTGATESNAGGSVSGGMPPTAEPEKEQQRGNTRPGVDRDGHGPAAGAIVDPTGAATKAKPF